MSTYFIERGNSFSVTDSVSLKIIDKLPPSIYTINVDPFGGYFLEKTSDKFPLPSKLYGNTESDAARILKTFFSRGCSTGVLLSGEKGSGKTLLAKKISNDAIKKGIPVLNIQGAHGGQGFNDFISGIDQPLVLIFDEFEKTYDESRRKSNSEDRPSQDDLLYLLDGTSSTNKLFILTCNELYKINNFMVNRPGRIYYLLEFDGLDDSFISDYCNDNLINKEHAESVLSVSTLFENFNFDLLKSFVEEMNRYGESAIDVMRYLNATPMLYGNFDYEVSSPKVNGKSVKINQRDSEWTGNPLRQEIIGVEFGKHNLRFSRKDIKKYGKEGFFIENDKGDSVRLLRKKISKFTISDLDNLDNNQHNFIRNGEVREVMESN